MKKQKKWSQTSRITPGVKDNPSMILIDRCKVMKENPPGDDWDGVYVMTTK